MLKVRVQQGATVWEEDIETIDDFLSAISANPNNERVNTYTVFSGDDIVLENIYFFEDDDDDNNIYTSSELNEEHGVNDDIDIISQILKGVTK